MPNLLLSQIKASERMMKDIKDKLIDYEYHFEHNPHNQEIVAQCLSHVKALKELQRDFDTLLSYCKGE